MTRTSYPETIEEIDFRMRTGKPMSRKRFHRGIEMRRRMEVIWDRHPDALLIVACQEGCTYFGAAGRGEWLSWSERWAA